MEPEINNDMTTTIIQQVDKITVLHKAAKTANSIAISKNNIASKLRFILFIIST